MTMKTLLIATVAAASLTAMPVLAAGKGGGKDGIGIGLGLGLSTGKSGLLGVLSGGNAGHRDSYSRNSGFGNRGGYNQKTSYGSSRGGFGSFGHGGW